MDGSPPAADLYQVLGVARGATHEDIKKAYRGLALKFHPDRAGNDPAAAARFREIRSAYEILGHPAKRKRYDRGIDPVASINDLFQTRAGARVMEVMIASAPAAPKRGVDIRLELAVSSELLRNGGVLDVRYKNSDGPQRFTLEIPSGAYMHPWVCLEGLGHPGRNGALAGALWIKLVEKPSKGRT